MHRRTLMRLVRVPMVICWHEWQEAQEHFNRRIHVWCFGKMNWTLPICFLTNVKTGRIWLESNWNHHIMIFMKRNIRMGATRGMYTRANILSFGKLYVYIQLLYKFGFRSGRSDHITCLLLIMSICALLHTDDKQVHSVWMQWLSEYAPQF